MEPVHGTSPTKDSHSLKEKSPSKKSPSKSPKNRSPKSKGPQGESFFSKLYCAFGYGSSSGKYRAAPVAKGVYFDSRTSHSAVSSVKTADTSVDDEIIPDWTASNLEGHSRGVPGVVRRPEYDVYDEPNDTKLLKELMLKARKLPQEPGKYANNHIMVNHERTKRNIPPLRRERHMDQIAREHAKLMAEEKQLFLMDNPYELRDRLAEKDRVSIELPAFERLGMNLGRGKDIAEAHRFMMAALAERNNIYDKRFFYMGMGTFTAENGVLYICQVFGG